MNKSQFLSELKKGWNTWNTRSVLSHVLLPCGFSISLGIKNYQAIWVMRESLIGKFGSEDEKIIPGIRSYDGSYTSLNWKEKNLEINFESAVVNGEQYILVTPVSQQIKNPCLIIEGHFLWNNPGHVILEDNILKGICKTNEISVFTDGCQITEKNLGITGHYLSVSLDKPTAISTGSHKTAQELRVIMDEQKAQLKAQTEKYGDCEDLYIAMSTCMAWDTIYEPETDKVCSTVSRLWNNYWGGYVLFCWDTYFAALLAMEGNKNLAYANLFAITDEVTEKGFIPNFGAANDYKSRDRSQPPVGSYVALNVYKKFGEDWILKELFPALLRWNEWWVENRFNPDNTLSWGSTPYDERCGLEWETRGVHELYGAALESGLDNSPMYDDVPFDTETHMMCLSDVGLTGLYILDCENLAEIADIIGEKEKADILRQRAEKAKDALETLWDEDTGIYQNKRTDTGEFYKRLSPTNFYALFSDRVSDERKQRMMKEHFYNSDEFWGEYIMPAIARNDTAYPAQDYWRGRIWAPTNFLAYIAMEKAGLKEECTDLAKKSVALFMQEWQTHGHVHENYNGDTGWGCDVGNSDKFYHWGALLCYIGMKDSLK